MAPHLCRPNGSGGIGGVVWAGCLGWTAGMVRDKNVGFCVFKFLGGLPKPMVN